MAYVHISHHITVSHVVLGSSHLLIRHSPIWIPVCSLQVNAGWSGKCFGFSLNESTGTPLGLANGFSPEYDNVKLPSNQRVAGSMQGIASVFWDNTSLADGKPCWAFGKKTPGGIRGISCSPLNREMNVSEIQQQIPYAFKLPHTQAGIHLPGSISQRQALALCVCWKC